jgi:hypothetical protein
MLRFSALERFCHWLTAVSFIILGLTGLNVTFGKLLLMPLVGPDIFGALSQFHALALFGRRPHQSVDSLVTPATNLHMTFFPSGGRGGEGMQPAEQSFSCPAV